MPLGSFINVIPPGVFMVIHIALFALGAYLAYRSASAQLRGFAWAFGLYALAELFYLSYHMDFTVILFAHTIAEVLDAAAFVVLFVNGVRAMAPGAAARTGSTAAGAAIR